MLTKTAIVAALEAGNIEISPFNVDQLNPNSYDLRLSKWVATYKYTDEIGTIDAAKENYLEMDEIAKSGICLMPGELYLMATEEVTYSKKYIPCIEGRSSVGRLGVNVHATAGFGDIGFKGTWTLEVSVIRPVRLYCGMRICQVYFDECFGSITSRYEGEYNGQIHPKPSKIHKEQKEWRR